MHQDYSEGFVAGDRASWPDEQRAGRDLRQTPAVRVNAATTARWSTPRSC